LGAVVSVTEDWAENCEGCSVVEDGAEGNGGWLDGWEICAGKRLVSSINKRDHFRKRR